MCSQKSNWLWSFALYEAFPRSLGGRDATDYYDHTDSPNSCCLALGHSWVPRPLASPVLSCSCSHPFGSLPRSVMENSAKKLRWELPNHPSHALWYPGGDWGTARLTQSKRTQRPLLVLQALTLAPFCFTMGTTAVRLNRVGQG